MDSFAAVTTGLILGLFLSIAVGVPVAAPLLAVGGGVAGYTFVSRLKTR